MKPAHRLRHRLPLTHLAVLALLVTAASACAAPSALALPEGRVLEMVSPIYKGGYGVGTIQAAAPDGESVAFDAQGAFAGTPSSPAVNGYLARREALGWSTVPLAPPASLALTLASYAPTDYSAALESTLTETDLGPNHGAAFRDSTEKAFLLHATNLPDTAPNTLLAGKILTTLAKTPFDDTRYIDASANFSHIVLAGLGSEAMLPSVPGKGEWLYDLVTQGAEAGSLRQVGLNDDNEVIDPYCPVYLGASAGSAHHSEFNAVSADGEEIFFTTNANKAEEAHCDAETTSSPYPGNPAILFVRLAGQRTLQVSVPLAASCEPSAACAKAPQQRAEFIGANRTGSEVYFTTSQPLVTGDTDQQNDLYLARIGCPGGGSETCQPAQRVLTSLTQVSHDPTAGEAAEVQGVVAISQDGSHVYFVAHGALSTGLNAEGQVPVKGAENLYVYDSASGQPPVFIADLCSGPEASGAVKDVRCPTDLDTAPEGRNDSGVWGGQAQTTADGGFLLFDTFVRLVPADADGAEDVYRYDAVTGLLDRVSLGEAGFDANGNGAFDATFSSEGGLRSQGVAEEAGLVGRAISEDGSRVVFASGEQLSPEAEAGQENAYEWHMEPGWKEGVVSFIAPLGSVEEIAGNIGRHLTISASGRDIFFTTALGLVPQDGDGANDVYDARLGGGFAPVPAPPAECSADACQGPLTNPASLLVPGSVSQAPGENLPAPAAHEAAVKSKPKPKPKRKAKSRKKQQRPPKRRIRAKRSSVRSGS